jgi:hypothetical protein
MNASWKIPEIKIFIGLALMFSVSVSVPDAAYAAPTERMAGTIPGDSITTARNESGEAEKIIHEADYEELESLGTLYSFKEGALGKGIWHGIKRSALNSALFNLSPEISSRTMTKLAINALLSRNDAGLIINDIDPVPGKDIYTLRLVKVIEFGLFEKAVDMYALQREPPYHPELARAGVIAMLGSGQLSLACLESKSLESRFGNSEFWDDLNKFCRLILKENEEAAAPLPESKILRKIATDPEFAVQYSNSEEIDKFSMLELAVLFAENRIKYNNFSKLKISEISSRNLGFLISDDSLPENLKLEITIEAVRRGIRDDSALKSYYESDANNHKENREIVDYHGWRDLPALYAKTVNAARGKPQWEYLARALEITPINKWPALLPFAQMISDSSPDEDLSAEKIFKILRLHLYADIELPVHWLLIIKKLYELPDQNNSGAYTIFLAAASLMSNASSKRVLENFEGKSLEFREVALLNQTRKGLDIISLSGVLPNITYEKDLGLTFGTDYVMPSVVLLDYFYQASKNKILGGVILFGSMALKDTNPAMAYPGLVRDLLSGLGAVGQSTVARKVALEAILGLINK